MFTDDGSAVELRSLAPNALHGDHHRDERRGFVLRISPQGTKLDDIIRTAVLQALQMACWNRRAAAKLLGIRTNSLNAKVRKFLIEFPPR